MTMRIVCCIFLFSFFVSSVSNVWQQLEMFQVNYTSE